MKLFATEFKAIDPLDGELKTWAGENIEALTWGMAEHWCRNNRGHLTIVGELVSEIPCKIGNYEPDFKNAINYKDISLN